MRIAEIQVTGLFGTFDHTIPLTNPDHITIIHGPNGFGKTVMLKMIAALIDNDISIFARIPFDTFSMKLTDGSIGSIRKSPGDGIRPKFSVTVVDGRGEQIRVEHDLKLPLVPDSILDEIDLFVPGPYERSHGGWLNNENGMHYTVNEITDMFPQAKRRLPKKYRQLILPEITEDSSVFFVETKRLEAETAFRRDSVPRYHSGARPVYEEEHNLNASTNLRVEQYSRDIVQRIKSTLADYAKHSQENDRTFPERLVRFVREGERELPERQILDRMAELETKRQRLISLGFLDSETGLSDLTEEDVRKAHEALTIYVGDVQDKLAVFDDLSQRVGKLIDIVNERFKYKEIAVHRERGFRVITDSGDAIALDSLSSGEQHELVVLYELLFRAPQDGLVLVDEPEISLHVGWQSRFLADLMGILRLTGSYGIVATHSPVIIGSRWDLTQERKGPHGVPAEGLQ